MPTFDANGNIIGLDQDSLTSNTDGAMNARNTSVAIYNGGGPVTSAGVPSLQSFDRLRSVQGKTLASTAITATVANDTQVTCSAGAMASIMPGQTLRFYGATIEYQYVSSAYVINPTATSIPLQSPLVQAGNTTVYWEKFSVTGAGASQMLPTLPAFALGVVDATSTDLMRQLMTSGTDTISSLNILAVAAVGYNGTDHSERMRSPNVYKPFNAASVTASSANTPTSIWTPAAGKKFRLMGYWFSTTAAAGLVFHDLASVGGGGLLPIPSPIAQANGIIQSPDNLGNGFLSGTINNQLWIDGTIATTLTGFVFGTQE